ncbi:MAG TPA: type II toxin-antitoxin system RelE/ParE family toxin, partial [Rhodospirillaceae bacterium]|nr:type II toxin-antitoxin system RelE/ParE family toxin [Rhodospirillaceae bacterium]
MSSAVFSPAAERDVLEIVEWISSDNPMAARGFLFALDTLAQTIGDH